MPNETITALISGLLVLAGVFVSQLFELLKRYSEENRWYADYFLPKKFESISNLYAGLQTTHGTLSIYRYRKLEDKNEYNILIPTAINEFIRLNHLASIYLPAEVNTSLDNLSKSLSEAGLHIMSKIENIIYVGDDGVEKVVVVDWPSKLDTDYTEAKNKVAKILTPEFLIRLERK